MSVHPDELTGSEQAVLLVLMAECRPVPNARLKDHGPQLTRPQREKLRRKGLIEVTGNPMVVDLTDAGWRMCRAIVGSAAPDDVTGQKKTLYTLMRALDRYLTTADLSLADVMAPADVIAPADAAPTSVPVPTVEDRVRSAYRDLADGPGAMVRLTRLRAALPEVSTDDLDAALRNLLHARHISLLPEENQKVLTDADDAAAILIGGQRNHLIAMSS